MANAPAYDEAVKDDSEVASFQLAGWVGAVIIRRETPWVAIRRPGGADVVEEAANLRTAIRHYASALNQAVTHSRGGPV